MARLSSDILEAQFGPTHVEVLRHDKANRIIRTLADSDKQVLEVSWVAFDPAGVESFLDVHQQMGNGASMGRAFEDAGLEFVREKERVRKMCLPFFNLHHFLGDGQASVTEVDITIGAPRNRFASILEIYSPSVKWPKSFARRPRKQQLLEKIRWFELMVKYSDGL